MPSLDVLIAARNEMFLLDTIEDIRKNKRGDTNIIAVLDGQWPVVPIPDYPDVQLVYYPQSIGQRAAVNVAARISRADYVLKMDAHCACDEAFDVKLMDPYENGELERDVTTMPRLYNLHVFDWQCDKCGRRTYQGPLPKECADCKGVPHHREMVWKPRLNRMTDHMRFDNMMHFQYDSRRKHDPRMKGTDFPELLGNLGACVFMRRDRFWELGGMDERHGSWGQYGTEVSCKAWLSGGRQVTNRRTWVSHLFRTQPGFGFCYPLKEKQVEIARKHSRKLWLENTWEGQTRPLSWLLERFWPIDGWTEADLAHQQKIGAAFSRARGMAHPAISQRELTDASAIGSNGQSVSCGTNSLSTVDATGAVAPENIISERDKTEMRGIDTSSVAAHQMVELWNVPSMPVGDLLDKPSVQEPMNQDLSAVLTAPYQLPVATTDHAGRPDPAARLAVDPNLREDASNLLAIEVGNDENAVSHTGPPPPASAWSGAVGVTASTVPHTISQPRHSASRPTLGCIFYTDNELEPSLAEVCCRQLEAAVNGFPIVSVSLKPMQMGVNIHLDAPRGRLTMFQQILTGLEAIHTDVAFLCEHDCLYNASCFQFIPPRPDRFYYNQNVWRVNWATRQAVTYDMMSVSGCCADRQLLVSYYRQLVAEVEAHGYDHARGYEAGVREGLALGWRSAVPYLDIRHSHNLTASRWHTSEFRDKRTCQGWQEAAEVPGWDLTTWRERV